jgi:hypothetical protein
MLRIASAIGLPVIFMLAGCRWQQGSSRPSATAVSATPA